LLSVDKETFISSAADEGVNEEVDDKNDTGLGADEEKEMEESDMENGT
jgi:hypothetical protein